MEETKEGTTLPVHSQSIKVTDVLKDGETLTFVVVSQKHSGMGEYHVHRTYDDFEWLQQHLFSQEDVPGIHGVIFPPLPPKAQLNASGKVLKQLGFLSLGEWQPYSTALETFLHQVAAHSLLSKNKAVEIFLTSSEPPGKDKVRKNIFNRLSQAVEEMRKEGHKDVDSSFKLNCDHNLLLTGLTKTAAERFLDVVQTEQKIAVACGHFSAALHLCVEPGDDPDKQDFSKTCVKISEVFELIKKNMSSVAENNVCTLGFGLDLESRCQDAEKEMLFRRTCKLVEMETAIRNAEKAKPVKKAAMEELKKAAEKDFAQICEVAKQEIAQFQEKRVDALQCALVEWCKKQLHTAKESAALYDQHLQAFKAMA
ncbi:LOW QUALITY PROTEIN: sorting nexin-6 [Thalassophryne amazonica]|uniref:LOW QUALITY PROTEIN: sorting nexin-6 n=1 Tax=Thalassophryne amazonica TaxID=390379 RepID=UPI001470AA2E|nr:LOW QUALITY PROTEIN: sorting nexin-6 [Thalassophryne amazonica]